jgi:FkbM family methyltransferase
MKLVEGLWYPDDETGLPGDIASLKDVARYILPYCGFGECIQAGGAVGGWARRLSTDFDHVHSFEPNPELRACFKKNCADYDNITLYKSALWNTRSKGELVGSKSWNRGSWHVTHGGDFFLDPIDQFKLEPSLIMLDIEGAELLALQGGIKTIRKHKPTIVVETKDQCLRKFGHSVLMLEEWLKGEGYVKKETFHGGRDQLWMHR